MKIIYKILLACFLIGAGNACTDDFAEVNTNPGVVTDPELRHLLTESLFQLGDYQYTEWFYDNYQYIWRYAEATVFQAGNSPDFTTLGATGGRYGTLYGGVMQNLFEIRRRIDNMEEGEKAKFQKFRAITYIPQVIQGIKVTDWYGSIPYTEAMEGRNGFFTPAYDNQQVLFNTWLDELDAAIDVLTSNIADQTDLGNQDFIYQGDYSKWAKLANSLKLRIAARLVNADQAKAQQVIGEVVGSPAGMITEVEDEMVWAPATNYRGRAHDFWGAPSAAKNYMDFLRENRDPRTRFFFEKNDFSQENVDTLLADGATLPKFVSLPVDGWDRYQGGPVSPDSANVYDYYGTITDSENSQYLQLSHVNRRFFNPHFESGSGYYVDVMFSAAEVNLYMAEFTEKGLVSGQRTAKEWYDKGIATSLRTYDMIAEKAQIFDLEELRLNEAEIDALLAMPDYALNGNSNLEKIYIQQYINFFRLPNEMGALVRRTGYPSAGSNLLPWEPVVSSGREIPLPRRFTVGEPGIETNLDNWNAAIQEQGFTHGNNEGDVLNAERVWWDKSSPDYGQGN